MALKFGIQVHFDIKNAIMDKFEMSDKCNGRHFEFQYGRQDEMLKISILGYKLPVVLKFGIQG